LADYQQVVTNRTGKNEYIRIKKLPDNILMLAENGYWYQYTTNPEDNQSLVTREDIVQVLRQDIQERLKDALKPTKP